VKAFFSDLSAFDAVSQSFACTFYLTQWWEDPRLTDDENLDWSKIWAPRLGLCNAKECEETYQGEAVLDAYSLEARGKVKFDQGYKCVLSCDMHLANFPFDSQVLAVRFSSNHHDSTEVLTTYYYYVLYAYYCTHTVLIL
jgi:hypothetical protein